MKMRKTVSLLLLLCAATSAFFGCGSGARQDLAPPESTVTQEPRTEFEIAADELIDTYYGTAESAEEASLLNRKVSLSVEWRDALESAVRETAVIYPESGLRDIEGAYERYRQMPVLTASDGQDLVSSLPLSPLELYDEVKTRNASRRGTDMGIGAPPVLEDDYLMWVCEVVCDTLNSEIPVLVDSGMLGELEEILGELTILKSGSGSMSNASVTDDNSMLISPQALENMVFVAAHEDAPSMTIAHETVHLTQKRSSSATAALGIARGYSFCAVWDDRSPNAMYYNWLLEAAAEKLAVTLYGAAARTYQTQVGYMDSLSILCILLGNDALAVPRLTQQASLERVFETFGCEGYDEQLELLNMLYSIEVMQGFADDYFELYEDAYECELSDDEIMAHRQGEKNALGLALGKYFYRNLSRFIAAGDLTLREVFTLISTFEYDFSYHLSYTSPERCEALGDALYGYTAL